MNDFAAGRAKLMQGKRLNYSDIYDVDWESYERAGQTEAIKQALAELDADEHGQQAYRDVLNTDHLPGKILLRYEQPSWGPGGLVFDHYNPEENKIVTMPERLETYLGLDKNDHVVEVPFTLVETLLHETDHAINDVNDILEPALEALALQRVNLYRESIKKLPRDLYGFGGLWELLGESKAGVLDKEVRLVGEVLYNDIYYSLTDNVEDRTDITDAHIIARTEQIASFIENIRASGRPLNVEELAIYYKALDIADDRTPADIYDDGGIDKSEHGLPELPSGPEGPSARGR